MHSLEEFVSVCISISAKFLYAIGSQNKSNSLFEILPRMAVLQIWAQEAEEGGNIWVSSL